MRATAIDQFIATARRIPTRWRERCPHLSDDDLHAVATLIDQALAPLADRGGKGGDQ